MASSVFRFTLGHGVPKLNCAICFIYAVGIVTSCLPEILPTMLELALLVILRLVVVQFGIL